MGHPTSFPSLSIPSEEFTIVQCSTTVVSSYQVSVIATRSQFSCCIMNFSFSCSFFLLRAFVWRNIRLVINPAVFLWEKLLLLKDPSQEFSWIPHQEILQPCIFAATWVIIPYLYYYFSRLKGFNNTLSLKDWCAS